MKNTVRNMSKNENENKNETTNGRASAPARVAAQLTGQPKQTVADRLPTLDQARVDALLTPEVMEAYTRMIRDYAAKSPGYPHGCGDHGYGVQILSEDTVRVCAVVDAEHPLCSSQWLTCAPSHQATAGSRNSN